MTFTNPGKERVAFKVKTTSPKKYCVRPSSGFVEAGTSRVVEVILQAQKEMPPNLTECRDKFLVQCVKVLSDTEGTDAALPDLFDPAKGGADVKQTKLRVIMLGPTKPPSPVPEGIEDGSGFTSRKTVAGETARPNIETESVKRRLDGLDRSMNGGRGGVVSPPAPQSSVHRQNSGAFSYIHILLVAVFAFLLGYISRVSFPQLDKLLAQVGIAN